MSGKYRGFWDPSKVYEKDDIVDYYSNTIDTTNDGPYTKTLRYVYNSDTPTRNNSPLKNFRNPTTLSTSVAQVEISLSRDTLKSFVSTDGTWDTYKYYSAGVWEGPHGLGTGTVLEEINDFYWALSTVLENPNYKNLDNYDVSNQQFNSSEQTTLFQGRYDVTDPELTEEFSEIRGETDSDAYYISSVQNYSGNFDDSVDYKKFDIVRNPFSKAFYYARCDISGLETDMKITFSDFEIREPTDYTLDSTHIATIDYLGKKDIHNNPIPGDESPWYSNGVSTIKVGHLLDLSDNQLFNEVNRKVFMIIGVGSDLIFLASFGEVGDKELATFQKFEGTQQEVEVDISSGQVNMTENDSIWSRDKFFFDADYGSTVTFEAFNKKFDHGDGYSSVSPFGINSLKMKFQLEFTNRSNREANAIMHFLENNLGQHEQKKQSTQLEYDQGIEGFRMDGESLFFPYNSTENLTRQFFCKGFQHEIENEDVHNLKAEIINFTASTLNLAHQIFVKEAPLWNAQQTYNKHDVVFCHENQKYYYYKYDLPQEGARPWVQKNDETISINKNLWTREFYWKPSIPFQIQHQPDIITLGTSHGPYEQYIPDNQQNVNLLEFDLEFENRSDEEAYAILHFLEMHLGYLSFLFVPPSPYNRKRRFYCESWSHTYVFKNNHTVSAKFKQFALGQNTPLDDDEIDNSQVKLKQSPGNLLASARETSVINQSYIKANNGFYTKIPVKLKNNGETNIIIESISLVPTSRFQKSAAWGFFKNKITGNLSFGNNSFSSSSGEFELNVSEEDGNTVYIAEDGTKYIQTDTGAVYSVDASGEPSFQGINPHRKDLLESPTGNIIEPGQEFFVELEFDSFNLINNSSKYFETSTKLIFEYKYIPAQEEVFNESNNYKVGNLIQYNGVVYAAKQDVSAGPFAAAEWDEYIVIEEAPINVVVNPELSDANISEINVTIDRPLGDNSTIKTFSIHANDESLFRVNQNSKNLFFDMQCAASEDAEEIAVPVNEEEIAAILAIFSNIEGNLYLGIKYDSVNNEYHSCYNYEEKINFDPDREIINADSSVPVGENLAINLKTGNISIVGENDSSIEGYVRQSVSNVGESSINLSEYLSSHESLSGMSIGEIDKFNITLTGFFFSESSEIPTISTGSGYNEDVELNIYFGTTDKLCKIIGRGGDGGRGMLSEGVMYENGQPVEIDSDVSPPFPGGNGGDAVHINQQFREGKIKLHLVQASILGGGGGGGGGGYQNNSARIKNYNYVNIGGGGGAGAGHAQGGFPLGVRSTSDQDFMASGGNAINNSTDLRNNLTEGGAGGGFGQDGFTGGVSGSFLYDRVGAGGKAGNAISWASDIPPSLYMGGVEAAYDNTSSVLEFKLGGVRIQDLIDSGQTSYIAGECLQRSLN